MFKLGDFVVPNALYCVGLATQVSKEIRNGVYEVVSISMDWNILSVYTHITQFEYWAAQAGRILTFSVDNVELLSETDVCSS